MAQPFPHIHRRPPRILAGLVLLVIVRHAAGEAPSPEQVEFFERRIRPVLVEHCYECHASDSVVLQGGLRLDTAVGLQAGGVSGPSIDPANPAASVLLAALRYESLQMPPAGRLPDAVIADFETWVAAGAPDPRTGGAADTEQAPSAANHWAFQRVAPPEPPPTDDRWRRTPIDAFVLARQVDAGVPHAPEASPRDLLRRVAFDLTGLPPTAEEAEQFEADPSDVAYEAAVDSLLASPRFGERWGRHWLDVARYADTKGYVFQEDRNYPNAYRYRDWVIASFNQDLAYDRFLVAQIAADQTDDDSDAAAMGFLTLGRRFLNNSHDIIDDRIDVVTRGTMGLTVACARCHDHKYDPIPTADYYSLYGVFASSEEKPVDNAPNALFDRDKPVEPAVFLRGNPGMRGEPTPRRFLSCLAGDDAAPFAHGSGRREMAEAIANPDNPLTARVWANRVWGWLFGRGLSATASDFGLRGDPPTHPELLDYLADSLTNDGWSTKRLIRRIVLSSTYRQSAVGAPGAAQADPENRLLTRMNRRRLDLEQTRDAVLAVSGRLDLTMEGPSQPIAEQPGTTRRAVYGFVERQNLPAYFRTFDFASPDASSAGRAVTTSPQQALYFLNSPLMLTSASALAERSLDSATSTDDRQRAVRMFRLALGRSPLPAELDALLSFVHDPAAGMPGAGPDWRFGWGRGAAEGDAVDFQELPHFTGDRWQAGDKLPDASLGWVSLQAGGGHPGDPAHPAVRRWVAPAAGRLAIDGELKHPSDQGDGVRGRLVSSRQGVLGEWVATHSQSRTDAQIQVAAGETIDFVTDCRANENSDSFQWGVTLRLDGAGSQRRWDSTSGFRGPTPPPLDCWGRLAQTLLMSNEFLFLD
ncbi:Planctomycete cytochrome C [Pirellulimonas nuda]|uniref:Planctomycete cytochrome C n=1 Tax=Pirellulimonas nuda TaxID=2528009 RepID=A0A518DE27_9BACT|nr:PSD1 and planctomycete cytochrome C domain-containing protein [Pirellulimonas nuda]QDU89744.1 Planctomycete cytochrome C [Pirellulimonas nuda]